MVASMVICSFSLMAWVTSIAVMLVAVGRAVMV
jgi:hypothetical protein